MPPTLLTAQGVVGLATETDYDSYLMTTLRAQCSTSIFLCKISMVSGVFRTNARRLFGKWNEAFGLFARIPLLLRQTLSAAAQSESLRNARRLFLSLDRAAGNFQEQEKHQGTILQVMHMYVFMVIPPFYNFFQHSDLSHFYSLSNIAVCSWQDWDCERRLMGAQELVLNLRCIAVATLSSEISM